MKTRSLFVGISLACTAAVGAVFWNECASPVAISEDVASRSSSAPADAHSEAGLVIGRLGYEVGDIAEFVLNAKFDLKVGAADETGDSLAEMAWKGTWQWVVVDRDDEKLTLVATMRDVEVRNFPGQATQENVEMPGLGKPTRAVLTTQGVVESVAFEEGVSEQEQQFLRTLWGSVSANQGYRGAMQWTSELVDGQGRFQASFVREAHDTLQKVKTHYLSSPHGKLAQIEVSKCAFRFSAGTRLTSLQCSEALRMEGEGPMPSTNSQISIGLTESKSSHDDNLARVQRETLKGAALAALDQLSASQSQREALDASWMRGKSAQEILSTFGEIEGVDQHTRHLAGQNFFAAVALLRQDKEAREEVFARIKARDKHAGKWIDAVGETGDRGAHERLRQAMEVGEVPSELRTRAMVAIVSQGEPSAATVDMLRKLRDDPTVSSQARYSLGAAARQLFDTNRAAADEVIALLVQDLVSARGEEGKRRSLLALVGVTSTMVVEPCLGLLADEDVAVRALAAEVLGYVPDTRVAAALASVAQTDRRARVRIAATAGLARQTADARWLAVFVELAKQDTAHMVRAEAVMALSARGYIAQKAAQETLAYVAENDPNANVRTLAGDAVRRGV